jgi:hypothetical protein
LQNLSKSWRAAREIIISRAEVENPRLGAVRLFCVVTGRTRLVKLDPNYVEITMRFQ